MRPRTFIALIALASLLTGLALVGVAAQSKPAPALTAMDYVQIRQLVSRYAYALDTGGNNGYDFADLFTADGEFIDPNASGREQLAALARSSVIGPLNTIHYAMNLVIEPTADGAIGRQYVTEFNFDDNVPPLATRTQWEVVGDKRGDLPKDGGQYKDVYVKTAKGWRFKSRQVVRSTSGGTTDPELDGLPETARRGSDRSRPTTSRHQTDRCPHGITCRSSSWSRATGTPSIPDSERATMATRTPACT